MPAVKNTFVRFAKIPIPPIITMVGKMPNHKFDLEPQGMSLEEGWSQEEPSVPAMDEYVVMQECGKMMAGRKAAQAAHPAHFPQMPWKNYGRSLPSMKRKTRKRQKYVRPQVLVPASASKKMTNFT